MDPQRPRLGEPANSGVSPVDFAIRQSPEVQPATPVVAMPEAQTQPAKPEVVTPAERPVDLSDTVNNKEIKESVTDTNLLLPEPILQPRQEEELSMKSLAANEENGLEAQVILNEVINGKVPSDVAGLHKLENFLIGVTGEDLE